MKNESFSYPTAMEIDRVTFKCEICHECSTDKFAFVEHKNVHSGETPFKCLYCGECFGLVKTYAKHAESECPEMPASENKRPDPSRYEINVCSDKHLEGPPLQSDLNNPLRKQLCKIINNAILNEKSLKTNDNYKCLLCQKTFRSVNKLNVHKKYCHSIVCNDCNKCFSTPEHLDRHACIMQLPEKTIKCSCLKIFKTSDTFKVHIGSRPYPCCTCSMKFNNMTNLIRHIRTHTKQKPYTCKDCGRSFSQAAHLTNHSTLHQETFAVKCSECNFSCKTKSGLIKHKKKHADGQLNSPEYVDNRKKSNKIWTCNICGKEFLFKRNMAMHMKVHSRQITLCTECGKTFEHRGKFTSHRKACHSQPSTCKVCNKVFASETLLKSHRRIHVSDKMFSCNVCLKKFSIKNYLVQHMKTHSSKKQFPCLKCGKLFKVAVSLKYHSNICTSQSLHL